MIDAPKCDIILSQSRRRKSGLIKSVNYLGGKLLWQTKENGVSSQGIGFMLLTGEFCLEKASN
uniref:Uncharacterized protein n=1 Tax=Siphoviridae sp. ctBCr48 TaxID=2827802 RepID=A0A8S5SHH6_9CAUD|nr:MAG TPA: hypothetical protein [Siphoviridae sp. ctBCr48]